MGKAMGKTEWAARTFCSFEKDRSEKKRQLEPRLGGGIVREVRTVGESNSVFSRKHHSATEKRRMAREADRGSEGGRKRTLPQIFRSTTASVSRGEEVKWSKMRVVEEVFPYRRAT